MTVPRPFAAVVAVLLLAGCSSPKAAEPQTKPIEEPPSSPASAAASQGGGSYALGQTFTLAWKEAEATDQPEDVNVTITATKFECGPGAEALLKAGKEYYKTSYGESSDAKADSGYTLCVASLKISNTGKKKIQHDPVLQAVDTAGAEYDSDDKLTAVIADPITHKNREAFGGASVSINPRETAVTAIAFQIPSDTKVGQLRYVGGGSVYSEPSVALIQVG
ncbi:DUF4352 domain-containing protein [Actinoplanes sp. NPDC051513]|uniref:DUF4352 domain-containing protein n=1 Tax=Actinoplanes sp. NPDC051513 TaxID=3363908 RepID=UPI00378A4DCD